MPLLRPKMKSSLVGVVLAGGLSSRLGHDKARIKLVRGEEPDLLARSVDLLASCCENILVVGREQPGYPCCLDDFPGRGPVGGIATALARTGGDCLVLSCDLPFMELEVIERLIQCRAERPSGVLSTSYRQRDTGHIEALVAVYEQDALPYFHDCVLQGNLKISQAVPMHLQHFLLYDAEEALPFFNINYPADLEVARRMMLMLGRQDSN